jgi:hypothetical protein
MVKLHLRVLFVLVTLCTFEVQGQLKKMDGLISIGVGYSQFNSAANVSELGDSSATVSKSMLPSLHLSGDFSLNKKAKNKWRVIFGFGLTSQSLTVNATDYRYINQTGGLTVDPFVSWAITKNTIGARLLFSYNLQKSKKLRNKKIFGFRKGNYLLYWGISGNLNWYGVKENTTNVNFNKNSFGNRVTEYQLVALGFSGFPRRKKVGFNFELAYGGPYLVKAGIVIGL